MKGVITSINLQIMHLFIAVCLLSSTVHAKYGGGSGEPNDPYLIHTAGQMNAIGANQGDWDKYFKLMVDIDLSSFSYERALIAQDTNTNKGGFQGATFTGVFDGNGHTISHLTIKGKEFLGLFGKIESGAEIKDLGVLGINIAGSTGSGGWVGGLAGLNYGTVTKCYSTGTVNGNWLIGGLVGNNWGDVIRCYSTAKVSDNSDVFDADILGGMVGVNYGTVMECYSTGSVSGNEDVGGLVGENYSYVTHCYSIGAVNGSSFVGGLVGDNGGDVTCCFSIGSVHGSSSVGGLVGSGDPDRVKNSIWDSQTSGLTISAGGMALITDEMMDPEMLGLNGFCNNPNWILDSGRDYPRLFWEGTPGQMIPEPVVDWLDGSGTPENPFQIENVDQLLTINEYSFLWDKHFILKADIDLDPDLPNQVVFEQAVIPVFEGSFIGNNHVIFNLKIEGGDLLGLFGRLTEGTVVRDLGLENISVHGTGSNVGGLVGYNVDGHVLNCYSSGEVSGSVYVGGLMGKNQGFVTKCYSTAVVSGDWSVGGLVGSGNLDLVTYCFWDTQTSGQDTSAGGTGLTTVEMQTAKTFLEAGWDFVGEVENSTEDIWWILEGQDYPKLRELPEDFRFGPLPAFYPYPQDGATEVTQPLILHWAITDPTLQHDIYFGEDKQAVTYATTDSLIIYRGRQLGDITSYDPNILEWDKTYYWRIDEYYTDVIISRGHVWSFTTANFLIVDDFESYNDIDPENPGSKRIWMTWLDGWDNPEINGSVVDSSSVKAHPLLWIVIVHFGRQSMCIFYDNSGPANNSEATANVDDLAIGQDWTIEDVGILSLWFRGDSDNATEPMYVTLANDNGTTGVSYHDNPNAAQVEEWIEWTIDLQEFADQGVDITNINTISIGFGNRNNPVAGGRGEMWFDDIRLYRPTPEPAL